MKLHAFYVLSALALTLPLSVQAKTWKEAGSDRSLEGEYVKTEGDQVVIRRADGNTIKIALAKLSDDDKKFVADQTAAAAKAETPATDVFKWETNLEVAKKRAKDEKKQILADFTGSDWCSWCHKLKSEVFDEPAFQEYAAKHYIMLELDFPKQKELPPEEKEQNEKMAKEFAINGYPTVLILNAKGREVGRTGYQAGGPEKYIEHLKKLKKGGE